MAAEGYSAGSVFLRVLPVFGDFQNAIKRQAKDANRALGDEMEKGGRDAGKRASDAMGDEMERGAGKSASKAAGRFQRDFEKAVKDLSKSMDPIEIRYQNNDARRAIKEVRDEIKSLGDVKIKTEIDAKDAMARLDALEARLHGMRDTVKINARADVDQALAQVRRLNEAAAKIRRDIKIEAVFEPRMAERAIGAFENKSRAAFRRAAAALGDSFDPEIAKVKAELERLSESEFDIDVSTAEARAKIDELSARLTELSQRSPEIDVKVNAGTAAAELMGMRALVGQLDGKDVDVHVDSSSVRTATSVFDTFLGPLKAIIPSGENASNTFRSFNIVIAALVTLLPAVIPLLGALGGGLLALGPAAAAAATGIGVLIVGFTGIKDAFTALGTQADDASKTVNTAAKKMRTANYAVADAEKALSDARRSAGQAAADAERQVADARRSAGQAAAEAARQVTDARRSAAEAVQSALEQQRQAQEDYASSVKDVQQAEQDLRDARAQAQKDEEQLRRDIAENRLAQQQGLLDEFNAKVAYDAARSDGSSTNAEVEQARINWREAQLRQKQLRSDGEDLAKQQKKWQKEGADGTETVQSAQDALTQAIKQQQKAYQDLGKASKAVDKARADGARQVADALRQQQQTQADNARAISDALRQQQRTRADNARAIADAQEALRRAQEGLHQAAVDSGIMATDQQKVQQAMSKLGPAGREFARYMFSLRDGFYSFRDSIQEAMLPGVETAMKRFFSTYGPRAQKFLVNIASGLGDLFLQLEHSLEGPAWAGFFRALERYAPALNQAFGHAAIKLLEAFASILTAAAPYAERLAGGVSDLADRFANWARSKKGQDAIKEFLDYAFKEGPRALHFFGSLASALVRIVRAMAPWGDQVLNVLTRFTDWIDSLPEGSIANFVTKVLSIATAVQAAALAGSVLLSLTSAWGSPLTRLIGIFIFLSLQSETFRDILKSLTGFINDHHDTLVALAKILSVVYVAQFAFRKITAETSIVMKAYRIIVAAVRLQKEGLLLLTIRANAALALEIVRQKALTVATKAQSAAMKAWALVTRLTTAVMRGLGIAARLAMGPWGIAILAVVGLFVLLYKKVGWFHDAVQFIIKKVVDVFHWIVDAAEWVWDKLFGHSIFPDIVDGLKWFFTQVSKIFNAVADVFVWLYEKIFKPVGEAIGKIVVVLFKTYFKVYFALISAAVKGSFAVAKWAWEHVLKPAFGAIKDAVNFLWGKVFKPVLGFIGDLWDREIRGMKNIWNNILKPVFGALGDAVNFLWKKVFKPVLGFIGDLWGREIRGMKNIWNNVLKPVFGAIGDALGAGKNGLQWVFSKAIDAIGDMWDGLKSILEAPIKFVVKTVINGGLIAGFNKIANWVGVKGFGYIGPKDWQPQKKAKGGILQFAGGGVMPGYTPGRDVHKFISPTGGRLELSGGEAILRPEFTAAVGTGTVDYINRLARFGGVNAIRRALGGGQQSFAKGGVFWPLPHSTASTYAGHDGVDLNAPNDYGKPFYAAVPGTIVYVGYGKGYGDAIFESTKYGTLVYGHSSKTAVHAGQQVQAGQYIGNVGSTGHSTGPHLHFGIPGGTYAQAMAILRGAANVVSSGNGLTAEDPAKSVPTGIKHFLLHPIETIKNFVTGPMERFVEKFQENPIVQVLEKIPGKLIRGLKDKALDIIPEWMKSAAETVKGMVVGVPDPYKGKGPVVEQIKSALRHSGFPGWAQGDEWAALSQIISHESGFNPNAKNPTSTAYGLFQFLTSTQDAYGYGDTAYEQTMGGAKYIKDRYGDPIVAWNYWQAHHWYADGGVVPDDISSNEGGSSMPYNGTMMYDSGGYLPPGLTTVVNLTGRPEPVFTNDQWSKMRGGDGGGTIHYEPHFEGSDLTASDVAADLNFAFRKLRRGGKYQGV